MDDSETLHRRARLRELVNVHFGGEPFFYALENYCAVMLDVEITS